MLTIWPTSLYWDVVVQDGSTAARRGIEVARKTAECLANRGKNTTAAALADVKPGMSEWPGIISVRLPVVAT